MPDMLRVIVVLAASTVNEILVTLIIWPVAIQPIADESELVADKAALKLNVQFPLGIVTLVGKVITTAAPIPSGLLVCMTKL